MYNWPLCWWILVLLARNIDQGADRVCACAQPVRRAQQQHRALGGACAEQRSTMPALRGEADRVAKIDARW